MEMEKKKFDNAVIQKIHDTVHIDKMNQIILIDGLPRTGKSELGLYIAEQLDPTFDINHIAWKYADFLKIISKSKLKGHQVFMWDEAGIADWGANARQFWSEGNLSASTLFQTMGFKENICIVNLPMKMMLDKHVRSLIHVNIKTKKVDVKKGLCEARVFFIKPKDDGKDSKTIFLRIKVKGIKFKLKSCSFHRASKELRKAYKHKSEIIKQELQQKLVNEALTRAEASEGKATKTNFKQLYDEVTENLEEYWDEERGKVDVGLVQLNNELVGRIITERVAATVNLMIKKGKIEVPLSLIDN